YAEYVAVDEELVALKPKSISFEEAAAVPLAGLTAWQCLVDFGEIKQGDKVLIQAGSGGVGSYGIQIAKSFGAYVISTVSGRNDAIIKDLVVDEPIKYEATNDSDIVKNAEHIVDTTGAEMLVESMAVVNEGARAVSRPSQRAAEKTHAENFT